MGDIGRYDPSRHRRRVARRLFDLSCRRGDNSGDNRRMIDGIRRVPGRASAVPMPYGMWHCRLSNYYQHFTRGEKLIVNSQNPSQSVTRPTPAGPGRRCSPALAPPGRTPARVKYIAQRA